MSWEVTESSWLVVVIRLLPVEDFWPARAKELCVVSHEYLLNGSPSTFRMPQIHHQHKDDQLRTEYRSLWALISDANYTKNRKLEIGCAG